MQRQWRDLLLLLVVLVVKVVAYKTKVVAPGQRNIHAIVSHFQLARAFHLFEAYVRVTRGLLNLAAIDVFRRDI